MYILVLDTIHGGREIACHLEKKGHKCDIVDIYRHETGISEADALKNRYDLIVAPVHLNPKHALLNYSGAPVISHHNAAAMILQDKKPAQSIEITGARGKTTTAFALAHILKGKGVLHTSKGTYKIPEDEILFKMSITPASVIRPALYAYKDKRWLIAEESLGVCGFSSLCILTSDEDYPIAGKNKTALSEKIRSFNGADKILLSYGVNTKIKDALHASDYVYVNEDFCSYSYRDFKGSFKNPLLLIDGYKEALATAAAAGCILGADPKNLESFTPVKGRMSVLRLKDRYIIDNSNSGVSKKTALMAASYAGKLAVKAEITLVIGIEAENICEGFSPEEVRDAIREIRPTRAVIVGDSLKGIKKEDIGNIPVYYEKNLESGEKKAFDIADKGCIVLCVKTWR
ncbi:MAG: coenzyme F430 synthase [Methanomicrobiaceae archaeon]|nr:coenzyme F430 synthase [Methanomicrobiaceae archaeon]